LYSILFNGNAHPVPALYTQLTGEIPPSKGLSSSFSEIVRGNFNEALNYNQYGLRVFAFFFIQLFLRVIASTLVVKAKSRISTVILFDTILSATLFAYCFAPLIRYTFSKILTLF
jgi:antibiotic biosynthesis monooxygenase (ABM) superfamily enzyme